MNRKDDFIACNRLNDGLPDCYANGAQRTEITNVIIFSGPMEHFNSLKFCLKQNLYRRSFMTSRLLDPVKLKLLTIWDCLLGRAQPVIPPNLYVNEHNSLGSPGKGLPVRTHQLNLLSKNKCASWYANPDL